MPPIKHIVSLLDGWPLEKGTVERSQGGVCHAQGWSEVDAGALGWYSQPWPFSAMH